MTPSCTARSFAAILPAAVAASVLLAPCAGAVAPVAGDADPIEGVWDFSITRKDCSNGDVLGSHKALTQFQRGGVLANDNSTPPALHSAMFGSWKRGNAGNYAVQMVFMRFNLDGTLAGTQRVQRELVLARDQQHLSGTVSVQTLDTAGVLVQRGCASEAALRIF